MMRCNIDDTAAVTDVDFQVKHTGDFLFHFISKLCKVKLSLRGSNSYFELRWARLSYAKLGTTKLSFYFDFEMGLG